MAAPKTRNWSARENVHKPKGFHLLDCGGVEVSSLNKVPQLAKTDSRDPKVLGLALTVVTDPATGRQTEIEMRPRAPLVVGLDWRF